MLNHEAKRIIDAEIIPKIETGDLALFLGPEASIGTPSLNGKGIPSTTEFVTRIFDEAGYPPEEATLTDFPTAFGAGQDDINDFAGFLKSNYTVSSVHAWQADIFKLWWKVVFTTNIDNIADEAILKNKNSTLKYPDYKIYNHSDFEPVHSLPTSPPVVHLHGKVTDITAGILIDGVSYGSTSSKQGEWLSKCALNIEYGNCLFIGTKFKGSEIDNAIRSKTAGESFNNKDSSWIVAESFTKIEQNHYLRKGITPIIANTVDFFLYINSQINHISPEKFL